MRPFCQWPRSGMRARCSARNLFDLPSFRRLPASILQWKAVQSSERATNGRDGAVEAQERAVQMPWDVGEMAARASHAVANQSTVSCAMFASAGWAWSPRTIFWRSPPRRAASHSLRTTVSFSRLPARKWRSSARSPRTSSISGCTRRRDPWRIGRTYPAAQGMHFRAQGCRT